eukprot:TRINITY_DN88670_c0_g1_i1.p1 TRINITY_DN88670_c0_g1~~TRINITY_DN88670_c0_g1_i1.p1  ORF type:complete len:301 (+),score=58.17 TRINITY_DN88670_c0_g1_i1:55-903(+)
MSTQLHKTGLVDLWDGLDLESEEGENPDCSSSQLAEEDALSDVSTICEQTPPYHGAYRCSSPLPCSEDAYRSELGSFSRAETLIIFDWDDTICPTTWLGSEGLMEDTSVTPSEDQLAQLEEAAGWASATLRAAKRRGHVAVVTNAAEGWVEWSCQTFMPSLAASLEGVEIISARTRYEREGQDPGIWKRKAFSDVVNTFYRGHGPGQRRNVISLGDAIYEREALLWVTSGVPNCWSKSAKFKECPDLLQLAEQHMLVSGYVDNFVDHDDHLDLEVDVPDFIE